MRDEELRLEEIQAFLDAGQKSRTISTFPPRLLAFSHLSQPKKPKKGDPHLARPGFNPSGSFLD